MEACEIDETERRGTDGDSNEAFTGKVAKILAVHQQQGRRSNQADHYWPQSHKGALDKGALLVPLDVMAGNEGEDKRRHDDRESGYQRTEYAAGHHIADIGSAVDADWTWSHL